MVCSAACRISGGKLCHSSFKIAHFLSTVDDKGCPFLHIRGEQHIQQIVHIVLLLQGFHKQRVEILVWCLGGIVPFPAAQQVSVIAQHPEAVTLHTAEPLFRGFLRWFPVAGRLLVLIGDGKRLCQYKGGFLWADSFQTGNKVDHIPVCLTAETVKAPVNLHAWVFVGMEGTDAHPVSSHPDSEMLGSLPGGNRLLDSFKYIQLNPLENKKSVCHSRKENGKRLLKFHILFFLCAGLLAFLGLFLPDTLRPAFDCLLDGWFLARLGGLAVLLGRKHLIEPVAHIPENLHILLHR